MYYDNELKPEISLQEQIQRFNFGFRVNGEPFNMMDNEYLTLRFRLEDKENEGAEPKYSNIDMRDCSHLTLLA